MDHEILLLKLKSIGLNSESVLWYKSYLSNRMQFVEVNGERSALGSVTCGVPQGSILGPLLFLIYVNDMPSEVKCDLYLYADDSALMVSDQQINVIESKPGDNLLALSIRLEENKLSLHLRKTESILFGSKNKLKQDCPRTMAQLPKNPMRLTTIACCVSINFIKFCKIKKSNQIKTREAAHKIRKLQINIRNLS